MKLVIREHWVFAKDNPWMPVDEWFGKTGDRKLFTYRFKKCIIIDDPWGRRLPFFEQFGGFESSYIGTRVIKILLNDTIEFKEYEILKRRGM